MAEYAIGDVQGCYDPLLRLLDHIRYNDREDRLWFVGDLVNRGPASLAVLRFIKNLPNTARIVLGNHDLHLLNQLFGTAFRHNQEDTFHDILNAPDKEELGHWLRFQPLLFHDETLQVVMCHAGINPMWTLNAAKQYAHEFEQMLQSEQYGHYLSNLYGNYPSFCNEELSDIERFRAICNYYTRMRFCDKNGHLMLKYKGDLEHAPVHHFPWYAVPHRCMIQESIIFGHWAALKGQCTTPNIYAIDTGCVWGGPLTALRLEDKQRLTVPGA